MTQAARDEQGSAAFRTRRLRLAILTGFAGRGASFLVQIVALPLAVAALGREKFGAYAMLAAILSWISVASVTITPGVTIQLVDANANNDREAQRKILSSALLFASALAIGLFIVVSWVTTALGVERLFGSELLKFEDELRAGLLLLSALLAANVVTAVAEGAQAGYQNQFVHNMFLSGGSLVSVVALALLVRSEPTISNMILAVYGPPVVARALSLVQLLRAHPDLKVRPSHADRRVLRAILQTGAAFSLTTFASFGYQSFSVFWVGRQVGPTEGGLMALCVMILNVSGSLLLLLTQPLWPAVRDAVARNDMPWARNAYSRTIRLVMPYAAVAAATIAIAGNYLAQLWMGLQTPVAPLAQWALGLYFLLAAWEHLNYSFLVGLGRQWYSALSYTAGALLMLLLAVVLVGRMGMSGMLLAMCAGPILTTAWFYPMQIARAFRHGGPAESRPVA